MAFASLEALFPFGALGEMLRKDFDRDRPVEAGVGGFVNLAHATGANGGEDFIRAEASSGDEGHS
jgi:hypothetical protein